MVMQARAAAGVCRGVTIAAKLAFRPFPELGSGYADDLGAGDLGRTFKPLCQAPRSSVDRCEEAKSCSCLATRTPHTTDTGLWLRSVCVCVNECVCGSYCVPEHVGLNL